jgi:hypothetical protein
VTASETLIEKELIVGLSFIFNCLSAVVKKLSSNEANIGSAVSIEYPRLPELLER